jgi:hypothetical protein
MIFASKHRCQTLASAILLTVAAVNAEADINPGNSFSGSGELILSVWDQTQLKSYSLDLGVSVDSLLANPSAALDAVAINKQVALGSSFAGMYVAGDTLSFNLAAANKYVGVTSPSYGFIVSHNVDALQALPSLAQATVVTDAGKIGSWATALNTSADKFNNLPVNTGAYSENLSEVSLPGALSYSGTYWGNSLNGIAGNGSATATDVGSTTHALQLYFYGDLLNPNKPVLLGNNLLFSLNADQGTLSWTYTQLAVPLPGAFWLFFSGVSLFCMHRRQGKAKV